MSITKINYEGAEVPIIERRATSNPDGSYSKYEPFSTKINLSETTFLDKAAVKNDAGKLDWTLVPFQSLEGMVQVLEFGAKKYAAYNWTKGGGFSWVRVTASCFRHLFAWLAGQDNDPESGLNHIYHAQCNLLFLAHYIRNKELYSKDDRVKNV